MKPSQFTSVDSVFLNNIVSSGAFFARKFEPDAYVHDLEIPVRKYIINMLKAHAEHAE